ncbi:type VI secretion system baseplate subunit TssF [Pseudoduganella sp. FT25W]|uniref:Type VI secretion system baseplate subunit TssF n=1 Tax=Duganella alba TaxID=2666081 RepID=A0A6L5QN61_9BURK|nr:type VI secretion system baseplate subunit TssF [Duganella alba]MRX11264.1 type VI secretion system baseplate subunit TssF [Duganella alba]MRX19136.1 type VI secretion system baseplate subunit TssF [Duganella alba]
MEKLLPYYERELSMLRRAGAEFAGRYPKLAGSLQIRGESCADPHVERLIQASAFLNARVAKLLDDGYSHFTEALLGMLYPHYLRPIPACSIAHIDYSGARANEISSVNVLPRGAAMKALGQGAVACRFRTVYDATVAPVLISAAWFEPYIQTPTSLPLPPDAGSAICFTIESTTAGRSLAALGLSTLRVFIDGEASLRATLRDALFMHTACACIEADEQWRMLERIPLAPVGFADNEALLPAAPSEHAAYRLLSEYFAFPEKFDFFDIDLTALAVPESCNRLTLRLVLSDVRPDTPAARILRSLTADNTLLGCTPIVNLFPHPATPIRITHTRSSYPLMPDEIAGSACEIYSIDSVQLSRKSPDGSEVTEFFPYYSLRHGDAGDRKGRYWLAQRDELMTAGLEYSLSLVDRAFSPLRMNSGTASIRLTCTNRNLPHGLQYGRAMGDLSTESAIGSFPIRMLRRPTVSHRLSSEGGRQWGLIAHLALNHRSLTQEGLPALSAMLRLYAQQDSTVSQRMIDGVTALSHRPATAWLRQAQGNAYLRGIEVQVSLDEEAYAGTGIHAFAQILDHLFGLHVHLNSFTRLIVLSHVTGKELLRCAPRNGALTLA